MFSVIIPLYNKASYVEKAVRSVWSQTYRDFELIIVDDGSTDASLSVVESLRSELSKTDLKTKFNIVSQKNSGVSTARNNGVKSTRYPYLCFLDADDWWEPTFLEEMSRFIGEFPQAGIYGTGYYIVKNGRKRVAPVGVDTDFEKGIIDYCKVYARTLCMPLTSISIAVPKYIFEQANGFKPALKFGEDFDLWVRIAMNHTVAYLNKPLAYYNQDVDLQNRAIGGKLYKPSEHMLFSDYGVFMQNTDFRHLYERLALYGLLPYYYNNVNKIEVDSILSQIDLSKHDDIYVWYYKRLPRWMVRLWQKTLKILSIIKNRIIK